MIRQIQKIYLGHDRYPAELVFTDDAPKDLYYIGDLSILSMPAIAIVGSRKPTEYGRMVSYKMSKKLSENGFLVVSGMATGIDTCAHKGALDGNGKTVAVLGCGLDHCYPKANEKLMKHIGNNGLLLSEYPIGTPPQKFRFPARNRIISGISKATVVVEAGIKSGSLITAEKAMEQGKSVYAVPGNIDRKNSFGCNKLIQDGAMPIVTIDDIINDFGVKSSVSPSEVKGLGSDEKKIYDALIVNGELSIDDLSVIIEKSSYETAAIVTVMEMKGVLHTSYGKILIEK